MIRNVFAAVAAWGIAGAALSSTSAAQASDVSAPTLTGVAFTRLAVDPRVAPGAFAVALTYADVGDDGTASSSTGMYSATVTLQSKTSTQSQSYSFYFNPDAAASGTVRIQLPALNLYSAPGEWAITSVVLKDRNYNTASYAGDAVPLSGPNPKVKNSDTPDIVLPRVLSAEITTPVVSTSAVNPYAAVKMKLRDDTSGVAKASFVAVGPVQLGGSSTYSFPVNTGDASVTAPVYSNSPVGTYTVTALIVCDVAGNCNQYDTTALTAVMPTLTFQVVN